MGRTRKKKIYFCLIDYAKVFDYVYHNKLENSSRDGNTIEWEGLEISSSK